VGAPLLAPLGLDYGCRPSRPGRDLPLARRLRAAHPAVIDARACRGSVPKGAAATLIGVELGAAHADPEKYDEGVDEACVARCREALTHACPRFADAPMRGGWAGMIMMKPRRPADHRSAPAAEGLWAMLGDSGTSFRRRRPSPLPRRVDHRRRAVDADLHPFRASRFVEDPPWVDADHYGGEGLTVSR